MEQHQPFCASYFDDGQAQVSAPRDGRLLRDAGERRPRAITCRRCSWRSAAIARRSTALPLTRRRDDRPRAARTSACPWTSASATSRRCCSTSTAGHRGARTGAGSRGSPAATTTTSASCWRSGSPGSGSCFRSSDEAIARRVALRDGELAGDRSRGAAARAPTTGSCSAPSSSPGCRACAPKLPQGFARRAPRRRRCRPRSASTCARRSFGARSRHKATTIQTLGVAGFFGVPIDYQQLGADDRAPAAARAAGAEVLRVTDTGVPAGLEERRAARASSRARLEGVQVELAVELRVRRRDRACSSRATSVGRLQRAAPRGPPRQRRAHRRARTRTRMPRLTSSVDGTPLAADGALRARRELPPRRWA